MKKDPPSLFALQDAAIQTLANLPQSSNSYDRKHIWKGSQRRGYSCALRRFMNGCRALGMTDNSMWACWKDAQDMAELEMIGSV